MDKKDFELNKNQISDIAKILSSVKSKMPDFNKIMPDYSKMEIPTVGIASFTPKFDFKTPVFPDDYKSAGEWLDEISKKQDKQINELELSNKSLIEINCQQSLAIEQLTELNNKKDKEIDELKQSAKKEKNRFWWTYIITLIITITGIVIGIIL